jgi:HSP20 family protein
VVAILAAATGYVLGILSVPDNRHAQADDRAAEDTTRVDSLRVDRGWPDDAWWRRPFDADAWDPFAQMEQMQKHMQRMFDDAWDPQGGRSFFDELGAGFGYTPEVELVEEEDRFLIRVDMHGIDASALEIEVKDDVLTLHGQREEHVEERDADGNITSRSTSTSEFSRALSLPSPVAADEMKSRYEDSVLVIELPKAERDI